MLKSANNGKGDHHLGNAGFRQLLGNLIQLLPRDHCVTLDHKYDVYMTENHNDERESSLSCNESVVCRLYFRHDQRIQ